MLQVCDTLLAYIWLSRSKELLSQFSHSPFALVQFSSKVYISDRTLSKLFAFHEEEVSEAIFCGTNV